jgi:hypothetical protein
VAIGKARVDDLRSAYADSLRAAAAAIAGGKSADEAKAAQAKALNDSLAATFTAKVAPALLAIVPEGADPTPAQRAALAAAYNDIAFGVTGREPSSPRAPPFIVGAGNGEGQMGWLDLPKARAAIAATFPARTLSIAAPQLVGDDDKPSDVYLYRAWKDVLGSYPDYPAQQIGDCTSFGSGHALDLLQTINIALAKGDKSQYRETSTEVIYGFGREVAGMLGRGDGGYGTAVAKGLVTKGALPREVVGPYSGSRAKQFGRSGVPSDLAAKAAAFKLGGATLVTSLAEADAALANGYPFIVCSNQGFTMRRDATGLCEASGRWAHCMFCAGKRVLKGEPQYLICQSWGSNTPSGPVVEDQPNFSFWIRGSVLQRMLSEEDSLAFSNFPGFVARPLPAHWTFNGFLQPKPEARKKSQSRPDVLPMRQPPIQTPAVAKKAA